MSLSVYSTVSWDSRANRFDTNPSFATGYLCGLQIILLQGDSGSLKRTKYFIGSLHLLMPPLAGVDSSSVTTVTLSPNDSRNAKLLSNSNDSNLWKVLIILALITRQHNNNYTSH